MKPALLMTVAWLALGLAATQVVAAPETSRELAAALADPGRPPEDLSRDALRRPAEMVAFAGIKPGDTVIELLPGTGYFTRVFSKVVGPNGHIIAAVPPAGATKPQPSFDALLADSRYANVKAVSMAGTGVVAAGPADVIWTSQNYHDLHLSRLKIDVPAYDKALFAALKPGGVLVIVDHSAEAGSGLRDPDKLHRIDEAVVKQEVEAAGFVLDGESEVLRNPADPRTALVFDPSIRGHTDQFVLRFKKPG